MVPEKASLYLGVLWVVCEDQGDRAQGQGGLRRITQAGNGSAGAGTEDFQRLLGHCFHMGSYLFLGFLKGEKQFSFLWGQWKKWKHFEEA